MTFISDVSTVTSVENYAKWQTHNLRGSIDSGAEYNICIIQTIFVGCSSAKTGT